jgi:hypothetical protein
MTVLIYVDTSKQVGDPDHLKVFSNTTPRRPGLRKTIQKAWLLSIGFWDEKAANCGRITFRRLD